MPPSGNSSLCSEKRNGLEQWKFSSESQQSKQCTGPTMSALSYPQRGWGEILPNNEWGVRLGRRRMCTIACTARPEHAVRRPNFWQQHKHFHRPQGVCGLGFRLMHSTYLPTAQPQEDSNALVHPSNTLKPCKRTNPLFPFLPAK